MTGMFVIWVRALLIWLVIILVETVHGILRTVFLEPVVGDFTARQIAVGTGSVLILVVAFLLGPWLRVRSTATLLGVGLLWVVLTVSFEFVLGRFVLGLSRERLLSDYDLSAGGLLVLGLVVLLLAPLFGVRVRRWWSSDGCRFQSET